MKENGWLEIGAFLGGSGVASALGTMAFGLPGWSVAAVLLCLSVGGIVTDILFS